ncbi:MAG: hypothetical protein NDJ89_12005 [Oligoflexia bacterium]|nr:hypothetical protein [Oligoflexia bacterium]
MRPKLAQGSIGHARKALILGPLPIAKRLEEQLRTAGFEATLQEQIGAVLPSIADPDAPAKLRAALLAYLRSPAAQGPVAPCLHPGTSFWAERPELVTLGQELGFSVLAPPPRVLALFASKLNLLVHAERLNIPHLLISSDPLYSAREIEQLVSRGRQPFPLVLKSAKSGPGTGHLVVHDAEELASRVPFWMEQLRLGSGETMLLAERYLEGARYVTVPFARSADGSTHVLPLVDASLMCRHRKLIEFCPAFAIDPGIEARLAGWTEELARSIGYIGLGSFDFLVDSSRAFFVGGQARLGTTFGLWEGVAGIEAAHWQLAAMEGRNLAELAARPAAATRWPHGIAIRIYAEDPLLQLPQPGIVREIGERREWIFPSAEARLETVLDAGEQLSPVSTGLLSQGLVGLLWARAQDRNQALTIARGALEETWIAGSLQTNERFLSELLPHPWVREGIFHAGFVDEEFVPAIRPPVPLLKAFAGVCAAIGAGEGSRWAVGDQWVKPEPARPSWVVGPTLWSEHVASSAEQGLSGVIELEGGTRARVCAYPMGPGRWQVRIGSWTLPVRRAAPVSGARPRPRILALVSGRVHSILFREGARIPAHEPLLVIESLGMLIPHSLPAEVRIDRWKVAAEGFVRAGEELAEFEVVAGT